MKVSVFNHGLAYNLKNNHARWEQDRQEAQRRRRLADVHSVVQTRRPPRPSKPGSRAPSVEGSRPSSQCSTPVLYKPRARSASPQRRLEPLDRSDPQGPPLRPISDKMGCASPDRPLRRAEQPIGSTPVGPAFMVSPGQRRGDLERLIAQRPSDSSVLQEEMKDWYFCEKRTPEVPGVLDPSHNICDYDRMVKPRLPPVIPTSDPADKGQQRRSRSQSCPRINAARGSGAPRSKPPSNGRAGGTASVIGGSPKLSGKASQPPSSSSESVQKVVTRETAPCSEELPDANGLLRSDVAAATAADTSVPKPAPPAAGQDLNSANAIQNWLAEANKRLAGVFGGELAPVEPVVDEVVVTTSAVQKCDGEREPFAAAGLEFVPLSEMQRASKGGIGTPAKDGLIQPFCSDTANCTVQELHPAEDNFNCNFNGNRSPDANRGDRLSNVAARQTNGPGDPEAFPLAPFASVCDGGHISGRGSPVQDKMQNVCDHLEIDPTTDGISGAEVQSRSPNGSSGLCRSRRDSATPRQSQNSLGATCRSRSGSATPLGSRSGSEVSPRSRNASATHHRSQSGSEAPCQSRSGSAASHRSRSVSGESSRSRGSSSHRSRSALITPSQSRSCSAMPRQALTELASSVQASEPKEDGPADVDPAKVLRKSGRVNLGATVQSYADDFEDFEADAANEEEDPEAEDESSGQTQ